MPNNKRAEEIRAEFLEMLHSRVERWLDSLTDDILKDIRTEAEINRSEEDCDMYLQDVIELIAQKLCNTGKASHEQAWLMYVVDKYVDILAPVWGDLDHAHNQYKNVVTIHIDGTIELVRKPDHILLDVVDVNRKGKQIVGTYPAVGIRFGQMSLEPEQIVRPATVEEILAHLRQVEDRELVKEID